MRKPHAVIEFLHTHLEQYGDSKSAIQKSIEYAAKRTSSPGGYVVTLENDRETVGAVVINKTGMEDYIPENIIGYIGLHRDHRGKGLAAELMKFALDEDLSFVGIISHMLVVDVDDNKTASGAQKYRVGDRVKLKVNYIGVARLLNSKFIDKVYV